ncbi:MAG: hypothetical protein L6405_02985 [Actinomycetia bacterium]|nr:hypothetical protein [Actinomycetes bacterium]
MKCLNCTAPYIDVLIECAQRDPLLKDKKCVEKLLEVIKEIRKLEVQGDDELRSIWIEAARGKISDFGNYEEYLKEETVSNYKEFVELWESYYPDEKKWYKFSFSTYGNEYFLFFDSELTFHITNLETLGDIDSSNIELIEWLKEKINRTISRIKEDTQGYNRYISKNLPYKKRFGRILRSKYWKIFPEECQIFKEAFPGESIAILEKIVEQSVKDKSNLKIKKVSAGDYFRFCEIGYDANAYFKDKEEELTPKEKYLAMADGRDCGLRKLDETKETAFANWYKNDSHCGGHPWEICRGGNSTHISLYLYQVENDWGLRLAGSSSARVVETVKMALAFYINNIPFVLEKAEEILRMIKGIDFIGIVPETIIPRYCYGFFPDEDRINDFMNLGFERVEEIIEKSYWYPIEEVRLIK